MNKVYIKNICLGEGIPKICVPIAGKEVAELIEEAKSAKSLEVDLVEWRVDYFQAVHDLDKVEKTAQEICSILKNIPVLFTFRNFREGGEYEISEAYYFELNKFVIANTKLDIIDIELFSDKRKIEEAVELAHKVDKKIIISNHDFNETPSRDEIVKRLTQMETLGADLTKIAVMPNSMADVVTLLEATTLMKEKYAKQPFVTMSMGKKGVVSRISGESFGSAITFASLKKATAPGQINVAELKQILKSLHL